MKTPSRPLWWALGCCLALFSISVQATRVVGPETPGFPKLRLKRINRGQSAIDSLGSRLPGVAGAYGMTARELHLRLTADPSIALDTEGRLLFTCEGPEAATTAPILGNPTLAAPIADTFKLHSRPGATKVIYLDFDGHTTTGTPWNSGFAGGANIVTPPYSTDTTSTFTDTELLAIQGMWQRVAEDYAPFDVDVTTEDPGVEALRRSGTTDANYGIRVCVGGSSSDWYGSGAGGVAYVGSFTWNTDSPAFVFPAQLGNGNEKYCAEAISHEAGHTMGLSHDGTVATATTAAQGYYAGHGSGVTAWAPIMGVSYYRAVTQWSKGEYANANNKEDDLAILNSYIPYRADDHGDTAATATYQIAGPTFVSAGNLTRSTDIDVIAFTTGAGAVSISIVPDNLSPNVDLLVELRNAAGTLITTANPTATLSATIASTLTAGTYFLHLRGTGFGDPLTTGYSSYGSIGSFVVTGQVVDPSGALAPVAVISATPASGNAPLPVTFNGSGSFDQDGTVTSYAWNFGDGTSATGAVVSKTYSTAGTYTAVLTVTDDTGRTGTASTVIQVTAPNVLPTAVITTTATTGAAPLAITFGSTGSRDPDGTIASYAWNFGDGTTGTGAQVTKTFSTPGTYNVTLTVTDNRGGKGTATTTIVATSNPATTLRVQSIVLSTTSTSRGKTVNAVVRVTNLNGANVSSVTVNGRWSGLVSGTTSGRTGSTGTLTFGSSRFTTTGTVTFTVTGLSRTGYTYAPAQNIQSSASISAAPTAR
jgi:PKD repeat protein